MIKDLHKTKTEGDLVYLLNELKYIVQCTCTIFDCIGKQN